MRAGAADLIRLSDQLQGCRSIFSQKPFSSFSGGFLNTVFFVAALLIAFYNSDYIQNLGSNATQIIRTLITYNAYIEWIVCTIVGTLVPCIKARITKKNNADTVETDII